MSLLEQDTTRKGWVDNKAELDAGNNSGKYKVEAIWDSTVYAKESESGHLPGLYYLVSWKEYPKEENTWEPASAVQQLRKLISSFYKDHLDKPIATSPAIDTASPMAKPTTRPAKPLKQSEGDRQDALRNAPNKVTKKRR